MKWGVYIVFFFKTEVIILMIKHTVSKGKERDTLKTAVGCENQLKYLEGNYGTHIWGKIKVSISFLGIITLWKGITKLSKMKINLKFINSNFIT